MSEVVEDVGGEFGATVRYKVHENGASVEFLAAEIVGRNIPDRKPNYTQKGIGDVIGGEAESFSNAERYVDGWVKWDGCSHVSFGSEDGQLHLCGKSELEKLASVLAAIYARCGELMRERGTELLDGEF